LKIVVKIGGSLVKQGLPETLMQDVKKLTSSNQVVLVHGGGDIVTEVAAKLGKEQTFVTSPEGIRSRYTDRETAEIYSMVMSGKVAANLVLDLMAHGINAVSVSGIDGRLMQGRRKKKLAVKDGRGRKLLIDGGYTGRVESVNAGLVEVLMQNGFVPLVSPVALSEDNEPLNVDGDRAAAAVAKGVKADLIVFLTNVDGLVLDGRVVPHLSVDEAKAKLPLVGFGMQRKVMAGIEAREGGVKESIICSGSKPEPLQSAMMHRGCTVIS
jgi:acetylglutamate/LysW-gamma-L-alpha-aminoadipate kinase